MSGEFWRGMAEWSAWGIAATWCVRTTDAINNFPLIENLTSIDWDVQPEGMPRLVVVVAGRDEEANIGATLDTLVAQDYAHLKVVAVNDRSADQTGAIMDDFAARFPQKVSVLHITELPPGWLGKTHAMAQALTVSESEYVLFTDADVLFSPSVLRRSLAYAVREQADHLVTMPTMLVKSWGEGVILGFFQILAGLAARPWKVGDLKAKRDVVGIGAFNLERRAALEQIGGLAPQRLAVLEDIVLARRVKAAGLRSRVAFAPGLVLVHWAKGVGGILRVMSKNLFSVFNFSPLFALAAVMWLILLCLAPLAGLFWWPTLLPGLLVVAAVAATYRTTGEASLIPARYGWGFPLGVVLFCYAMLRSVVVVWKDGGVKWRGTLYPLRELRRHNNPVKWMKQAK